MRHAKTLATLALGAALCMSTGCLRTRLMIDSTPEGAVLTLNNTERGRTPIEAPVNWYWEYKIELQKEGYQDLTVMEDIKPKIWTTFPLDIFVEAMPFPVYDTRHLHYTLQEETEVENLLEDEDDTPAIDLD